MMKVRASDVNNIKMIARPRVQANTVTHTADNSNTFLPLIKLIIFHSDNFDAKFSSKEHFEMWFVTGPNVFPFSSELEFVKLLEDKSDHQYNFPLLTSSNRS